MFLLGPIGCQVYVVRTSPRKHRVCAVLPSSAPSPFAHVYLICQCASSRKHRVCAVLLSSVLFPFCTRLIVLSVCFASQTPGLCSASVFGSLPLLHTFICFVGVLRLANTGLVQCFYLRFPSPFAHVYLFCQCASPRKLRVCAVLLSWFPSPLAHVYLFCQCGSPRKHRVCVALPFCTRLFMSVCLASQTPGLCCAVSSLPYEFVRFYALFVLYNRFCGANFALQASGLLGPKPKFLFGFVVFWSFLLC